MRLCNYVSLLIATPLGYAAQVSLNQGATTLSDTLVSKLSADPEYTSLLRLLQRARLIPTLNKLNGSTLFAPTNDAISKHAAVNTIWQSALADDAQELRDNIQEKLRQELFYHLLNHTLPEGPPEDVETLLTLHYPRTPVEPPSREPPPNPPWMPIPGGSLGGQPQRLRVALRDEETWVGVDAFGKNGVKTTERVNASNGVVLKVDEVLNVPPDLGTPLALQLMNRERSLISEQRLSLPHTHHYHTCEPFSHPSS